MQPPPRKQLIRLATKLRAELEHGAQRAAQVYLPEDLWSRCLRLAGQLHYSQRRCWQAAGRKRRDELRVGLERLRNELLDCQQLLESPAHRICSLRDLVLDLAVLYEEFDNIQWDTRAGTLSVTTEAIHLEQHYLGPFAIVLEWRRLDAACPYRVVALDPQPAARDSSVTHPHVQDEMLCEGDGRTAIRAALGGGRLYDFFCLVAGILRTYNHSSPYVDLHEWNGSLCNDCGGSYDDDDCSRCARCEDVVCNTCSVCCDVCGDYYCSDCSVTCDRCDEPVCISCLGACSQCSTKACENCLTNTTKLCGECDEPDVEDAESAPASLAR